MIADTAIHPQEHGLISGKASTGAVRSGGAHPQYIRNHTAMHPQWHTRRIEGRMQQVSISDLYSNIPPGNNYCKEHTRAAYPHEEDQ